MCSETISKLVLIAINVFFFIGGGAILTVGLLAMYNEDAILQLSGLLTKALVLTLEDYRVLTSIDLNGLIMANAVILVIVGSVLFTIGFFGCCGAMKKSVMCLTVYCGILLVVLAAEVGLGVYAYMHTDKLEAQIRDGLKMALDKTYVQGVRFDDESFVPSNKAEEIAWDAIQFETQCCGVMNSSDWTDAAKWNKTYEFDGDTFEAALPPSCCKRTDAGAAKQDLRELTVDDFVDMKQCIMHAEDGTFNNDGCYDRVRELIFDNQNMVLIVFVIIILIEVLAVSFACFLKAKSEK